MSSEVTEAGMQAMEEFGFELVELSEVGAPTPGRVADRLSDIVSVLEDAVRRGDREVIEGGLAALRRLGGALDAWDIHMLLRAARRQNLDLMQENEPLNPEGGVA